MLDFLYNIIVKTFNINENKLIFYIFIILINIWKLFGKIIHSIGNLKKAWLKIKNLCI